MINTDLNYLIVDVVAERYTGYSFVLFHGSRLHGTATPESDVDIIVVYRDAVQPFREIFLSRDYVFDAFVYDVETINFYLLFSKKICNTSVVSILNSCITLPEATDQSICLLAVAKEMETVPCSLGNIDARRIFLTNLINDIQKSTDHSELVLLSSEISKIMIDIILAKKGVGGVFRKYTHSALKKNAPDFYLELNCATKQAVLFANKEPILKIAREILAGLGGELKDGFKMFLPDGKRLPLNTSQGSVV